MISENAFPTKENLQEAQILIKEFIHRTPVLSSISINKLSNCCIYFKCENFQKMGAFKMRGAAHAIQQLNSDQLSKGVATHSSGNFAQAIALSAKLKNIHGTVVMPENAPEIKKKAVRGYGADIVISGSSPKERENKLEEVLDKLGATFIHPSNDINVIIGNATSAMELLEDHPDLDYIIAPVGGGGLLAGTALATHYLSPQTIIIGAEPAQANDAFLSLQKNEIQPSINPNTIADGLRTNLGSENFPIIKNLVDRIILVEEQEIIDAMRMIWERMKIIIEPSSAVAFAAVMKEKNSFKDKKVGIIISGGNVDLNNLPF